MDILFINFATQNSSIEFKGNQIYFHPLDISRDYQTYGLIVISSDISASSDRKNSELEHAERAIIGKFSTARENGSHICILLKNETLGTIAKSIISHNVRVIRDVRIQGEMLAETPEMLNLVKVYGNVSLFFDTSSGDFRAKFKPILQNKIDPNIFHGIGENSKKGCLFVISAYPPSQDESGFARRLVPALFSQIEKLQILSIPITDDFIFSKERDLVGVKIDLEQQLDRLTTDITKYQPRKNILFLRDDPLANTLPNWIMENLGIATKREEQYLEDFWLTKDDEGIVICEAKGLSKNVKREHVTQLIGNRQRRDLPDNFPAILVVNTFSTAETVFEKDKQQIPSDVVRWAVRNNILIVRTLDLIRLADLIELEELTQEQVLERLLKSLGWLTVTRENKIREVRE